MPGWRHPNPTVVNDLAATRPIEWFEQNVISMVPFPNAGMMRRVYPGFIQLTGFMTMNLDRHRKAHWDLFENLVKGDCDSVPDAVTYPCSAPIRDGWGQARFIAASG